MALATTEKFASAMVYAHQVHKDQRRKGTGIPYIAHVLGVTAIAIEYGANEDGSIAALLHDAAEDGGGEAANAEMQAWLLKFSSQAASREHRKDRLQRERLGTLPACGFNFRGRRQLLKLRA